MTWLVTPVSYTHLVTGRYEWIGFTSANAVSYTHLDVYKRQAYTVIVALDEHDRPLGGAAEFADVVRDGVVTDFIGAVDLVRRLKARVEERLGCTLTAAHGAYPPGVPRSDVRAVQHVIESADLELSLIHI